ncbi:MAG TPA: protein kinase [Vicinamibacterales bacterium]
MTPAVQSLFHLLADLPPDARRAALDGMRISNDERREVEILLAYDFPQGSDLTEALANARSEIASGRIASGSRCGPYRLVELLGAGGMGAVYLGQRDEGDVEQRVAVKLLNSAFSDPHLEQQLLSERRLLARLSHPNIARFLDCGKLEGGQPYFAMEYVDGQPIDRYCERLHWREVIEIFRNVCEAAAYAHANLIVHRDLKPGNVLVTADGEPKLIDFGVGKLLDLDERQTQTALRMLTPAYASPEQLLGNPVGTAADVYGLGATLYHLLAGRPPFDATSPAADIATREPLPLHAIRKGIPRDLSNIVARAMRPDPSHRYGSVAHLVADLEALVTSRPVSASSRTWTYRLSKFSRRYWIPLTASAVALAGLTGGLAVANHQLGIAQRRFDQVRTLANEFLSVDRNIRQVAGMTAVRQHIVRTSLSYLEALAAEARGDPALALELARGYEHIAVIQAGPGMPNLGDQDGALDSFEKGQALVDVALDAAPADPAALRTGVRNAFIQAQVLELTGRPKDSARRDESMRRGASLLERLVTSPGFGPDSLADAASGYQATFRYYLALARYDEAERYGHLAVDLARQEVANQRPRARASLGRVLATYADVLRATGRLEASLATAREAGRVIEEEIRSDPTSLLTQIRRLFAYNREAIALADPEAASLGRWAEAYAAQQRVIDGYREMAAADAGNMDARASLAEVLIWQARSWRIRGNLRAAEDMLADARAVTDSMTDPEDIKRRFQAQIVVEAGHALRARGRLAEAWQEVGRAQVLLEVSPSGGTPPACESAAAAASELAMVLALDQDNAADDRVRQFESTLKSRPHDVLDDAACVSWRLDTLRAAALRAGRVEVAQALTNSRTELSRYWRGKLPADRPLPWQLADASGDR